MKKTLFLTILLLLTVSFSFAQSEVLVGGNPPLTQENVDSLREFYERGLNIEFSAEQREEFQSIIIEGWRKSQKTDSKGLSKWLDTVSKINSLEGEKREKIKDKLRDVVLADLRKASETKLTRLVLGIYENSGNSETVSAKSEIESAQNETSRETAKSTDSTNQTADDFKPVAGAIKFSDLVGKWNKGTVATYGYQNTTTNDYRSGYGAANMHVIYANGNFDYTNYAQVSGYGCTTELFTSMKGRVSVSGSQVTFNYVSGNVKGKDSCKSEGFNRPAQIRATTYRLERDKDQLRLCEIGAETPYCLYKEKQ